ncbi:hypothetical protein CP963_12290 [Arcobacter cloacae]|uniref:Uncharacterized protein n=3 Tax=Arcobacter cloacae TaxID=1054034 RepID=A0A6M8NS43_9BACT|nr:putative membrane protein [Arcobacter cloacae]RXI37588.1 hypothetical protein CP963_12290 [Arcobacter cloacae]
MLLLFVVIFDPSNKIFKLKEIAMISIFLLFLIILFKRNFRMISNEKVILIYLLFGLILPLLGIINGLLQDIHFSFQFAVGHIKSLLFFFIFLILINIDNDFEKILIKILNLLAITIIVLYLGILFQNPIIIKYVNYLVYDVENALIGPRQFGSVTLLMVFYKTAPLLLFVIGYIFSRRINFSSIVLLFIIITALIFSGTRANIIMSVIILSLFIYMKSNKSIKIILTILFIIILGSIVPFIIENFLNTSEGSNSTKIGHFISYLILFENNPYIMLFGHGIGSGFYSYGNNEIVQQTELVYLDLFRMFGLILFSVFILLLLYPILFIYKEEKYKAISYICYLIVAGTNPLLIGSTGILVIVYVYFLAFKIEMKKKYLLKRDK